MNDNNLTNEQNQNQRIIRLASRKEELKRKIKNLQGFAKKQFIEIEILERRIKRNCDLNSIEEETIKNQICKKRKILEYLNVLENENTKLKIKNRALKRTTCCHRNEC